MVFTPSHGTSLADESTKRWPETESDTSKMCVKERRTRNRTEAETNIDTDRVGMTGKR